MSAVVYDINDAFLRVIDSAKAKFVESVDIAICLGVNPRKSEEQVRGIAILPNGIGREIKVAAFSRSSTLNSSISFGADVVGGEDLVEKIKLEGVPDVDWCVTTADFMPTLSKIAKILGPRGLMPTPKFRSVVPDLAAGVKSIKSGQIRLKTDKAGIIHAKIGNVSFSVDKLKENYEALIETVQSLKPSSVSGVYIKKIYVNSTMGFSCKVS